MIAEKWSAGEKTLAYAVELAGEGRDLEVSPIHPAGRVRTYRVFRVAIRTRWLIGQEGETFVTLHVREVIGGRETWPEGKLYLNQLREVPDWLDSIIDRATPRDVG